MRVEDAMHATKAAHQEGHSARRRHRPAARQRRPEGRRRPHRRREGRVQHHRPRVPRPDPKQIVENAGEDGNVVAKDVLAKADKQLRLRRPRAASTPTW